MSLIVFFDLEINPEKKKITDIGAIRSDDHTFHKNDPNDFFSFIKGADFLCGHNIVQHDLKYLQQHKGEPDFGKDRVIDTLLLSPLLFPKRPYHKLVKDDKLQTEELNNPFNDSIKAKELFYAEAAAFQQLDEGFKKILFGLLHQQMGFSCFFKSLGYDGYLGAETMAQKIRTFFQDNICAHCNLQLFVEENPVALAYTLALLHCNDRYSITPPWVLKNYPEVERLIYLLRNKPCITGCNYCNAALNPIPALKSYFGFTAFRSYGSEPLQENAVRAAIGGKSILTIFPTGGGKSITFQVPALMSGVNTKALTVVISPLQSLMKDQVDNLERKGITEAVTINGLLDPIERSKSVERVENGQASLLYISPESLRSVTIERLLLKRKIARFVIDEAHCFSAWGQDFRVDYLYIGDFIKKLQKDKNLEETIPVSCFTATAKQKVIEDIRTYFREKLNLDLEVFKTKVSRPNLHYQVFKKDNEEDKYNKLRDIIEEHDCPAIVYVSRTQKAYKLAERLSGDGFNAKPYHGKMDREEKTANQNAFMKGDVQIMVATSAFGMGVDKSDVGAVIHYDISDSLENYIQEAGRAGRDEAINAECYVLFNEEDLDKHFILLNQTKMSSKEINQIWKAIKELTRTREKVSNSALEIARKAGWDDGIADIETRVKTAIAALEQAGYLKRGQNMPLIFASSILTKNAEEAIKKINASALFNEQQKVKAIRIIKKLFSQKSKRLQTDEEAESRIDYISDQLAIVREEVIRIIELLREEKILANTRDLTAFIKKGEHANRSLEIAEQFGQLEKNLLALLKDEETSYHVKEINEQLIETGVKKYTPAKLKTILNFWAIKKWIQQKNLDHTGQHIGLQLKISREDFAEKIEKRHALAKIIAAHLCRKAGELEKKEEQKEDILVDFSVLELKEAIKQSGDLFIRTVSIDEVEDTLFYLCRIEAIKIEGGFLVVYNKLLIDRREKNLRIQYKESDYEKLRQFYQQKVQQIHIVGEYAKKMIQNYKDALHFVDDYFTLNDSSFLSKYFPGSRQDEIKRTLTPEKFRKLFGSLSPAQLEIINDAKHPYILVAAGPGSGKTRVLVHKLASLLLAEDVKSEQLLMLTFSRAAATEFKKRLLELIGNAAIYIEIKTFHSYCFDLLGRLGNIAQSGSVLKTAVEKIQSGDIENNRITKTVLVVDEAQDMSDDEYQLVKTLMYKNEGMRVILVGDDDQNIYAFRGSDSKNMQALIGEKDAQKYELADNYRSKQNIVELANQWVSSISGRLKEMPGVAIQKLDGAIQVVAYSGNELIVPLAEAIIKTDLSGSTCVLTQTNEEALLLTGLLNRKGKKSLLIQSNEGFALKDLYEARYFTNLLNDGTDSPLITDEAWTSAKLDIQQHIKKSTNLELLQKIIKEFDATNPKRRYKSDWIHFLSESKMEDFTDIDSELIYVSTIHKAKGKEFDNVFLLLNNFRADTNEKKREFYVALTRAKTNLHIHYNGQYLDGLSAGNLSYTTDHNSYAEPSEIVVFLNHKDVWLSYFLHKASAVNAMSSDDNLTILEDGLGNLKNEQLLKYSQKFKQTIAEKKDRGFLPVAARINYIVYWKDPERQEEMKIILPKILFRKDV
jgi:ATP-dependent DNA helicase RecQ